MKKNKLKKFIFDNVPIAGKTYKVKLYNRLGGCFDTGKKTIDVAIYTSKEDTLDVLLHEIVEAIATENKHRYKTFENDDNSGIMFAFDHKQFENIIRNTILALSEVIDMRFKFRGYKPK